MRTALPALVHSENVLLSNLCGFLVCGVSVLNWTDSHIPRTTRPVHFIPRTLHPALLARADFKCESFTLRFLHDSFSRIAR